MRKTLLALLLFCLPANATELRNLNLNQGPQLDAFSRLRVSSTHQVINYVQSDDELSLITDEELGGTGTATFQAASSGTKLATSAASDFAIRQTYERLEYSAGRSMLILFTVAGFAPDTNVTKEFGYFHTEGASPFTGSKDGLVVESGASGICFRSYNNGSETFGTCQGSWTEDDLDGTGPSGVNLDFDKLNLYWMDYQWLGAGRVRFGVVQNGKFYLAHEGGNFPGTATTPFMQAPTNPLRWQIRQSGAGSGDFTFVCASVFIEGHNSRSLQTFAAGTGATSITTLNNGTKYAVVGTKLSSNRPHGVPKLVSFSLISTTNDDFYWELIRNPTVAGTFTYSEVTGQSLQTATGAASNTVTNGTILASGTFSSQTSEKIDLSTFGRFPYGIAIDGTTMDEIVLVVEPFGSNASVAGSMTWGESW